MRFARVPTGRETCGWCYMLASRGFGYTSAQAASAGSHEGCDCLVVPGADGETSVEGYDPEWMRSCWSDCVSTVANDSLRRSARAEWDAMAPREREAYRAALGKEARAFVESSGDEELARIGLDEASRDEGGFWRFYAERAYDEARREVELRDPRWLYDGERINPTFASESIRKSVSEENPWELRSGIRLSLHGIAPDFIRDYEWVIEDGIKKKVGLPDLSCGVEIKTPMTSGNARGAVKNYLANCESKVGVVRIVIDNSESLFSDEDLYSAICHELPYYRFRVVAMLCKSGELKNVYR